MATVPAHPALAAAGVDTDTSTEEILLAATNHDLNALRALFRSGSARIQDPDTGFSPLHAAIAACEPDEEVAQEAGVNGEGDAVHGHALDEQGALATVQLLFENGAIWNELDHNDETPGCLALKLGLKPVYEAIVAAGVRAELLFNRLDEYEPLPDGVDEEDDDHDDDAIVGWEPAPSGRDEGAGKSNAHTNGVQTLEGFEPTPYPSYKVDEANSPQPAAPPPDGVEQRDAVETGLRNPNVNSADYLSSELTYSAGRLLDSDKNAIMMDWETEIMKTSADQLCPKRGLRTMNIGFGMGIVDSMFMARSPLMHHIVEAHPAVIARMREQGWHDKPNVTVHEGKWQDVLPKLVEEGVVLDAIYYDTYAEDYKDLKDLFSNHVITLLDSDGLFGFYNGLGADRQVCYDVYTKVVEMDLFDAGLDVEWTTLSVPNLANAWEGIRRPYWGVEKYRLPTCRFVG